MAAAEMAALEGLLSSPDTQECKRIFETSLNYSYDIDSQTKVNDFTYAERPQLSQSAVSQSQPNLQFIVPEIRSTRYSHEASTLEDPQVRLSAPLVAPHFTGATSHDTSHALSSCINSQQHIPAKSIDVYPARPSALQKSNEKDIGLRSYGIAVISGSKLGKMEDSISPLYGTDGSNLSPTQENDPSVYERLDLQPLPPPSASPASGQARVNVTQEIVIDNVLAPSAGNTETTYAANDTGHLTLDYLPPNSHPMQDSFEEDGEVISGGVLRPQIPDSGILHPQTPSQTKLNIGHPGTVMRLSQMFAETQPSPGSRDRHMLPPSSSRPSPDVFNQYIPSKHLPSSPLAQRLDKLQSGDATDYNVSSSPEHSQPARNNNQKYEMRRPLSERRDVPTNAVVELSVYGYLTHQNSPELFDYTTVKESQERRRQQASMFDDIEQLSDDGFSDDEAELNRRAKRRKEEAARELAVIRTPRPGNAGKDFVEVPSTNTGRRRSLAEEYEAQCSGLNARDTQPDATIVDSQSALADVTDPSTGETIRLENHNGIGQSNPQTFHCSPSFQENPARSTEATCDASTERLPAWEHIAASQATESDRGGSKSPDTQDATSQLLPKIGQLQTPATHNKKLHFVDGDITVLETSPSEPHLQLYGGIVSQTPPVLSAEEIDDAFNPLTQDIEFNNLVQSPSPRRTQTLPLAQSTLMMGDTNMKPSIVSVQTRRAIETSGFDVNPSINEEHKNVVIMSLDSKDSASDNSSEYVTAPTGLPPGNSNAGNHHINFEADLVKTRSSAPHSANVIENHEHKSQLTPHNSESIGNKVNPPEVEKHSAAMPTVQNSPRVLRHVQQQVQRNLGRDEDHTDLGTTLQNINMGNPGSQPAKRRRQSPRSSLKVAQKGKLDSSKVVDDDPVNVAATSSKIVPTRLRSAVQVRGSSRTLRRLLDDNSVAHSISAPSNVTVTPTIQKKTRSSRRSSANSSEKAGSIEPEANITPSLSTRRRTLSIQPTEPGLFESMVFSVTYSTNREDVKKAVLAMIKRNGGRVLEKGFDELFDAAGPQTSSIIRNNEADDPSGGSNLSLNLSAERVGFACVIADEHSRRVKFMQALALGLPCISGRWIEHCVVKKQILDWDQYHLAAGESSLLGGAIRSRNLAPYSANTANFANRFAVRPKLLTGKSILLVTGKGRVEERRKPYFFLTQALGARRVMHVPNNQEARKFLLAAESNREEWDWVYVDENEGEAEKAIFGVTAGPSRKRKRGSEVIDNGESTSPPRKVRIVSDEYVIQSLILGKFIEE